MKTIKAWMVIYNDKPVFSWENRIGVFDVKKNAMEFKKLMVGAKLVRVEIREVNN